MSHLLPTSSVHLEEEYNFARSQRKKHNQDMLPRLEILKLHLQKLKEDLLDLRAEVQALQHKADALSMVVVKDREDQKQRHLCNKDVFM